MIRNFILLVAITLLFLCCLSGITVNAHVDDGKEHCAAGWQQTFKRDNALQKVQHCLEEHGWDVNSTEGTVYDGGRAAKVTALHTAAGANAIHAVRYLIYHGANLNSKNVLEMTPLHMAAVEGYSRLCHMLVAEGAIDTDRDIFGDTPLDHAARYAHVSLGHAKCAAALDPENFKVFRYEIP